MPIYASGPFTRLFFSIISGEPKIMVPCKHHVGVKGDLVNTLTTVDPTYIVTQRVYRIY
jgi:hypothetical protein